MEQNPSTSYTLLYYWKQKILSWMKQKSRDNININRILEKMVINWNEWDEIPVHGFTVSVAAAATDMPVSSILIRSEVLQVAWVRHVPNERKLECE